MSFSDEDLKRLKEYCEDVGVKVSRLTVLVLIDRLEAAEAYIESHPEDYTDDQIILWKAWRKSAGRV